MSGLKKLQSVFQALADYNRLTILKSICEKECSVGEIVNSTNLSQPLVSHHLRTLKNNGFLDTKRKGPFIYYHLKDPKILYTIDLFLEIFKDVHIEFHEGFQFCSERMFRKFNQK